MGDGGRIRFVGVDVHFQFELRIDPDHDIAKHGGAMVRIDLHVDPIVIRDMVAPSILGRHVNVALRNDQAVGLQAADRSEEHTSELQSLMRNSYAVFCLKKQKNKNKLSTHTVTE